MATPANCMAAGPAGQAAVWRQRPGRCQYAPPQQPGCGEPPGQRRLAVTARATSPCVTQNPEGSAGTANERATVMEVLIFAGLALLLALYFAPSLLAYARGAPDAGCVLAINILAGW